MAQKLFSLDFWRICLELPLVVSRCEAAESPLRPLTAYRDLSDLLPVTYLGLASLSKFKESLIGKTTFATVKEYSFLCSGQVCLVHCLSERTILYINAASLATGRSDEALNAYFDNVNN